MSEHYWKYVVSENGSRQIVGPVPECQLVLEVECGNVTPDALVASPTRSQSKWYRVSNVPALMRIWHRGAAKRNQTPSEPKFVDAKVVPIPAVDEAIEIYEAEIVDESEFIDSDDLERYSDSVKAIVHSISSTALTYQQRIALAVTVRSLNIYRIHSRGGILLLIAILATTLTLGFAAGLGVLSVAYGIPRLLFGFCPNFVIYLCCIAVLAVTVWVRFGKRQTGIELFKHGEKIDGYHLGRLHGVLRWDHTIAVASFIGVLFGTQVAAIYFSNEHLGIAFDERFSSCMWMTLDNVFHGIFLDTFEVWNLSVTGSPLHHTFTSATLFLIFRVIFDVLFLLILIQYFQRHRMKGQFDFYSVQHAADPARLGHWIHRLADDEDSRWHDDYPDELIFLTLVKAYVHNDFELVRQLARQFAQIDVAPSIRQWFVDADGEVIFESIVQPKN